MCKIISITNRKLCRDDFLRQIEEIAEAGTAGLILREKDMRPEEYEKLARQVMKLCGEYQVECILHSFPEIARKLGAKAIHLPMPLLRELRGEQRKDFQILGASCHSLEEAVEAQRLGCTYITAGHVFETDCKKGLPPRGLEFLKEICNGVEIPVYGLGGIDARNARLVLEAGAAGVCVMSALMCCRNPKQYINQMKQELTGKTNQPEEKAENCRKNESTGGKSRKLQEKRINRRKKQKTAGKTNQPEEKADN